MNKFFPDGTKLLKSKNEEVSALDVLPKEGVVGIYFSAHWCPPCRGFTPKLAEAYNAIRAAGKSLEIVFASSDKTDEAFQEYFAEQPWLALPYANRAHKDRLSKKFKVSGIPMLVLIDAATGSVITTDGRTALSSDPEGKEFPWTPPTLQELLGDVLLKPDGTQVNREEALKDKYVGIYFSAHWCPPCKGFTPILGETYKKIVAKRSDFEVVFVSGDKSEAEFKSYHAGMPWLALPFNNKKGTAGLNSAFGVSGIPTFVLVGPDGKTLTKEGRAAVGADPDGAEFPWLPKPINELDMKAQELNETTCFIAFIEDATTEQTAAVKAALTAEAEEGIKAAAAEEEDPDMIFLFCSNKGGMGKQVRELCGLGNPEEGKVQLAIVDVEDNGAYYVFGGGAVNAEVIKSFKSDFKAGNLERKQLK
eukprot:CAMPEP_0181333340 /NCGR_PEP_ID=MMETSP1101-20121128/25619_1 /TAXON_ID=46948 /ORGANISM="Rhodomonas abbreviata, Strain Caron Lab Isolate" /LENGTH=419 /DNA_ID=CAMNT_0023443133 /DNA_START=47 /DNA_END=1306 /DNA_ORIENTATION=-